MILILFDSQLKKIDTAIRAPSSHFIRRLCFYIRAQTSRDRYYSIGNPFCQLEHFHSKPRARDPNLSASPWTQIDLLFIRITVLSNGREYRRAMENAQRDLTLMANRCPQTANFPASAAATAISFDLLLPRVAT